MSVPVPSSGEVLIRVRACGLCGTDVEILSGERKLQREVTLGHEIAGIVSATGTDVPDHLVGRRVVVMPIVSCGTCRACQRGAANLCVSREVIGLHRDGGLAQYVAVPARNIVPLPNGVTDVQGAIAVDAVATPFRALVERAKLQRGETVAVFGVGGLGQHAIQIARSVGAVSVIGVDPRPEARDRATELGANRVVDATEPDVGAAVRSATDGNGVDIAIGFAGGAAVLSAMLDSLDSGGRAVMVAMTHADIELEQPGRMVQSETALLGSYGFSTSTVTSVLDLVASGALDLSTSISHVGRLEDVEHLLGVLERGIESVRRVVIVPH